MEQDDRRPGRASERGVTPRKHAAAKPPAALFLPPPATDETEPEEPGASRPARRTSPPAAAFRAAPAAEQLTVDLPTVPAPRPRAAAPRFEAEPEPSEVEEPAPVTVRRTRKSSGGTEKATPTAEQTEIIEAPPARATKKAPTKRTTSQAAVEPTKPRTTKPRKAAAKPADPPSADLAPPAIQPEPIQQELPTAQARPEPPTTIEPSAAEPSTSTDAAPEAVSTPDEAPEPEPAAPEPPTSAATEPTPAGQPTDQDEPEITAIAPETPGDEAAPEAVFAPDQAAEPEPAIEPEAAAEAPLTATNSAAEIDTAEPRTTTPEDTTPEDKAPVAEPATPAEPGPIAEPDDLPAAAADAATISGNGMLRGVAVPRTRGEVVSSADLWAAVKEQPRRAPAALALAAVASHAGTARRQAELLRRTYPHVDPDRLVRVSIATASRRARVAALAATLPLGGVAGLSAQLWAHARMVLEIAALYGFDPAEPARAAEMLALLGVYPEVGAATAAVHAIRGEPIDDRIMPAPRVGVATAAFVRKAADRLVPGSAIVLAALGGSVDVDELAARTVRFYRARRA